MASRGQVTLSSLVDSMIKIIDETRRLATKVPVDTSSFITMAFYLGEMRDVLTHVNTKQRVDVFAKNPEALTGMQRLAGSLEELKSMTSRAANQSSRLLLVLDTAKLMSDLQRAVQEVGHGLNLVPVLSIMSSTLPSDVSNKLADLRSRMRAATFDSEPEILELSAAVEDAVAQASKKKATEALARVLRHFGLSSSPNGDRGRGTGGAAQMAEAEHLKEEVQKNLAAAEKDQHWNDVGKLMDLKTFLGLASLSQEPPIAHTTSRLSQRVRASSADLAVPEAFKCPLTGEVMRDPVRLVESGVTFERSAVEQWFARGKRTCPSTQKLLRSLEMVPNVELRKQIEEDYQRLNERTLSEAIQIVRCHDLEAPAPPQLDGEGAGAGDGGDTDKGSKPPSELEDALEALQQLTALDSKFVEPVLNGGIVEPLIQVISKEEVAFGQGVRELALRVLSNLAASGDNAVMALVEAGCITPTVKIITADSKDVRTAVELLKEMSKVHDARPSITDEMAIVETIKLFNKHQDESDSLGLLVASVLEMYWRDDPYVAIQMASVGMFHPLIQLLGPGNDIETRLMMADGVTQWGVNKASRVTLVQGGVLPPLVDLLNNPSLEGKAAAARSIEHLSHTDINRVSLAKAGVIPALVKALARGSPEVKSAAQATLANLAMDDQDLDSLDEDGTAVRLITMLRVGPASNREYAIRTLECMARESKSMRAALMEDDGAVPSIFEALKEGGQTHGFTAGSLRSTALLLLNHLCFEPGAAELMVAPAEVIKSLSALLSRPIPQDEREAIVVLIATMAGNKKMRGLIRTDCDQVFALMYKQLQNGKPKMQESMMRGFAHLADPNDVDTGSVVDTQQAIARLGIIPTAVHYLKMGPDVMRIPSTTLLGNLSLSTPALAIGQSNTQKVSKAKSWKMPFSRSSSMSASSSQDKNSQQSGGGGGGAGGVPSVNAKDKVRSCKVHNGKCSLESTFCLVEGELVGVLLELVRRGEDSVAEVSLAALASLLGDDEDQERAADYLVKLDAVEVAAGVVGRNKNLTKWAVYILERIFHFKKYRSEKYSQPAITAIGRYMTTATGQARKTAAETIMRLNILPKGSIEGSL